MILIDLDEIYLMVAEFGGKIQILNFSDFFENIFFSHIRPCVSNCPIYELVQAIRAPNLPTKFHQNRLRNAACIVVTDGQTDGQTDRRT